MAKGSTFTIKTNDASTNTGFGPGGSDNFNPKDPASSSSSDYQIIINGGTITVDADGDGLDSNGNIFIKGGTTTVNGPTNAGNGALDYGDNNCFFRRRHGTSGWPLVRQYHLNNHQREDYVLWIFP